MKFRAKLELHGKTATGITVPAEIVAGLGPSKRPAVRVTIAGHTYRSTVAVMCGEFLLPVSAEIRAITGAAAGDEVEVDIELDTEIREVTVPPDFAEALQNDPATAQFFAALSYSNKRQFTLSIESAKTPETRQRRIEKSIATLREGRV